MRSPIIALTLILAPLSAMAQTASMDVFQGPTDLKWGPAPPFVPKGAQVAVLTGDPSKDGPFVIRVKMPAHYQVPAHHHPATENITVLSGGFHAGMGDKLDKKGSRAFAPGGFVSMPANMNHFAWTTGETVIEISSTGPLAFVYVNPADDPSKAP